MRLTRWIIILSFSLTYAGAVAQARSVTLDNALKTALAANPEIAAQAAIAHAEHGAIRAQYSLDNPRFGLMRETNMNLMERQMGPMNTWSISQPIKFPTKYFLMGSAQKSKAKAADQKLSATRLKIRHRLITAYYNLFSIDRVLDLLIAQRETMREMARSAESRHAVGAVPQQDEMKAHVEQTKIEANIISVQQEQSVAEASLNELMGRNANTSIKLPKTELSIPLLKENPKQIEKIAYQDSRDIKQAADLADSANTEKSLAAWNFAPDFMLTYKQGYGSTSPDMYSVGLEISFPLWFFAKQSGEYQAASARSAAAEKTLDLKRLQTSSEVKSLISKVTSHEKLLQIYQTSLIPQASTTLQASRGAYRAGTVNFLELLDSERSLYAVRMAYYRTLSDYIDNLTHLEQVVGTSLSSLPMGGSL